MSVKKEVKWNEKKVDSLKDCNDRYLMAEYSSGYSCNDSSIALEESHVDASSDAFPLPLNPLYDLSALVMVSALNHELKTIKE